MANLKKLTSLQMASFAANGYVRLDEVVPSELNERFIQAFKNGRAESKDEQQEEIPAVPPGTPILDAYPKGTVLGDIMRLSEVRGAIESLVGAGSLVDHHFVHTLPPASFFKKNNRPQRSQHIHQDSTIDPRTSFDIQLFYFPQDVPREMGGTRFVPGTHLRIVSESAIARYQNIRGQEHITCQAGTIFFMHHGMWHGGGINHTEKYRYLYKLRLNPVIPQVKLWDTSDLDETEDQFRPIFFVKEARRQDTVQDVLMRGHPWFEGDTGRIELIQRVKFWRRLLGDQSFDADYWVSRLECDPYQNGTNSDY